MSYSVPEAIEALGYDASNPPYLVHRAVILMVRGGVGTATECDMARHFATELDEPCAQLTLRYRLYAIGDGYSDGNGYGDGYGDGNGNGDGDGFGFGYGYRDGNGSGNGDGHWVQIRSLMWRVR